jgi:hypothetical protein
MEDSLRQRSLAMTYFDDQRAALCGLGAAHKELLRVGHFLQGALALGSQQQQQQQQPFTAAAAAGAASDCPNAP